jgi:hypothetical protein
MAVSGDLPDDPWRRGELGRHGDPVAVADPSEVATSEGLLSPYPQRLTSDEGLVVADGSTSEGASVVTDDLAAELAAHAPRRLWNKATVYLGAGALVVAGFLGGVQVQKNYGTAATTTTAPGAGRAGFAGNAAANGYFGGQAGTGTGAAGATGTAAAAATTGKVKLVDGTTVYVETSTGDVVTVKTGAQTQVKTSTTTTLKNLAAGDTVTIQGATGSDGTVTATTVTKDK